jgi:hypothetical protein
LGQPDFIPEKSHPAIKAIRFSLEFSSYDTSVSFGFSRLLVGQKLDGILCPSSNGFSAPQGFRGRRGRDDDHLANSLAG